MDGLAVEGHVVVIDVADELDGVSDQVTLLTGDAVTLTSRLLLLPQPRGPERSRVG